MSKSQSILQAKLPFELYIKIFEHLEFWEILRCMRVCSLFEKLITETASLQYIIELAADGLRDEPRCTLSSTLRLERLKKHREAHRQLKWSREIRIPMQSAGLWELCGGVLGQDTEGGKLLFHQLPSDLRSIEEKTWIVDENFGFTVRDFGMDPSQDLLALVEGADWSLPDEKLETRLHLRSLTTGKEHPLAPKAVFSLMQTISDEEVHYVIQVFGNLVSLFIHGNAYSELAIWDWQEGRMLFDLVSQRLYAFSMLSENWVLLCITNQGHDPMLATVNFRKECSERQDLGGVREIHHFSYPEFADTLSFYEVDIRADPGPLSKPNDASRDAPFSQDPREFILVISMQFISGNDLEGASGESFVHYIPAHRLLSLSEENQPSCVSNFQWNSWAPIETRLNIASVPLSETWVCYVHGTKYASLDVVPGKGVRLNVFDFNQLPIRRDSNTPTMSPENHVEIGRSMIEAQGMFCKAVHTRLPFWHRTLAVLDAHDHCAVLCSEDALILVDEECGEYRIFVF